ncbi:type IV secretion system DNA-binding domain-containing protein [Patescibacteria group bacterium]|nr:type IV secretion system DNA-binding domain-containing protein [Patescibacteria group bacterium]
MSELIILILVAIFAVLLLGGVFFGLIFLSRYSNREKKSLYYSQLLVRVPKYNEIKIEVAETMFTSFQSLFKYGLHGVIKGQDHIGFEIVAKEGQINFYVSTPLHLQKLVEKQIHSYYPDAEIEQVPEYNIFQKDKYADIVEFTLRAPVYKPILDYKDLGEEVDGLNSITTTLSKLEAGEAAALQILISPAGSGWQSKGFRQIQKVQTVQKSGPFGNVMTPFNIPNQAQQQAQVSEQPEAKTQSITGDPYKKIEEKSSKPGFEAVIRFLVSANSRVNAESYIESMAGSLGQFNDPVGNGFIKKRWPWNMNKKLTLKNFVNKMMPAVFGKMILTSTELATLFHFPNKNVVTPNINWLMSKKAAAPLQVPTQGLYLGKSKFRGVETKVHITADDRRRHMYIIGQTGTGKSEFLKAMVVQDIKEGKGVCFIDPHGSAIEDILLQIPPERAEDVILFDAGDTERPFGLNILEAKSDEQKHQIVNNFISLLYKLYDPKRTGIMGPRLERAIRNVLLTAMSDPASTLVEVMRLLTDPNFVKEMLPKVTDPLVRRYWSDEVAQTTQFHKSETMGYFVSKFDRFVTDKLLRNIIGQSKSSFNFREVMDQGKILLVDLSKGKIGEENSNFLGLILVPRILVAAMSRVDIPEDQRRDFYLYVDEFQNFTTPDFAQILSEARKYHLNLTVANQFIAQITEENIREAIFGNVGTMIAFRVGMDDAQYLEHQFDPVFNKQDLINNPVGQAYIRLLVQGQPTVPFSVNTDWELMKNAKREPEVAKSIVELSRHKYGRDRAIVEADIIQRAGLNDPPPASPAAPASTRDESQSVPASPPANSIQRPLPPQPQVPVPQTQPPLSTSVSTPRSQPTTQSNTGGE